MNVIIREKIAPSKHHPVQTVVIAINMLLRNETNFKSYNSISQLTESNPL